MSKQNTISWTKSQKNAIDADGGRILVSAAAGSGKTAVLVGRVINKLIDKNNTVMANEVLVVTFSNAAAKEMRERIELKLSELIKEEPDNFHYQRQRILLSQANISTVHAFCLNLIRENFHLLDISPDFRIADEGELELIKNDALVEAIDMYYDEGSPEFLDLVELLSDSRDDKKVEEVVLNVHSFIGSHPYPNRWMDENLENYNKSKKINNTIWGKIMIDYGVESVKNGITMLGEALSIIKTDEKIEKAYFQSYYEVDIFLENFLEVIEKEKWDDIVDMAEVFIFPRRGQLRGYNGSAEKNNLDNIRENVISILGNLKKNIFFLKEKDHKEDMEKLYPIVDKLFKLVKDFSNIFYGKKQGQNILDFTDMEHMALMLLVNEDGVSKTHLAEELSKKYKMILVDEYQDTNEVQDLIFRAVSNNEKNLFMVGDVKQSIYSFRQAMPEIFIHKKNTSKEYDEEKIVFPAVINLNQNFRSREGICQGINRIFKNLMSKKTGGVDYNENEKLVPGASYPEYKGKETTILAISTEDNNHTIYEQESHVIAEKISEMIDAGYMVYDGDIGGMRPCEYRDFCILLRSRTHMSTYEEAMERVGIPVWSDFSSKFFETKEIMYLTSFLKAIDNPLLDVEIVSSLMSPMFGFTPDDLAEIRLLGEGHIFLLLQNESLKNNKKVCNFLSIFNKLRVFSISSSVDKLIQKIFELTFFDLYIRGMKNGSQRMFNIQLLISQAKDFESAGYRGLSGFNRITSKMMEKKLDIKRDMTLPAEENIIKIMTMHRSKGLEFPICFVCGLSQEFNLMELNKPTLMHKEQGFGCKNKDLKTLKRYGTLPYEAIKIEMKKDGLSEEMRILYVAFTRAKEKLFICISNKNLEKKVTNIFSEISNDTDLTAFSLLRYRSFTDWILYSVMSSGISNDLRIKYSLPKLRFFEKEEEYMELVIFEIKDLEMEEKANTINMFLSKVDDNLYNSLLERVEFSYKFPELTEKPSKLGVSELAENRDIEYGNIQLKRPKFMYKEGLTPTEKGNAHHTFMQFADYKKAKNNPASEIDYLYKNDFITKEEAEAIDIKSIAGFFKSSVYNRMEKSDLIKRELKFIVSLEKNQNKDAKIHENSTMIQGVVDCMFFEDNEIVIVDYKTDRVKSEKELIDRYKLQLDVYGKALEESFNKKVKEKIIYAFSLGKSIIIK